MSTFKFTHFSPLGDISPKGIVPNFTGRVDVFSPKKNIANFEETATQSALNHFTQKKYLALNKGDLETMIPLGFSTFGFPIYSNLVILGDSYKDNSGNVIGQFKTITLEAVIMEISNDNNVISTDIQGRNGTVIEYISSKSWAITVTGRLLAKKAGIYPVDSTTDDSRNPKGDNLKNLIVALNCNKALRIQSWFLNAAGIYNLVVKKKTFPQDVGGQEYQKFEFEAISDKPTILKMRK